MEIGEGPCGPDSEIFFDQGEKLDPDGTAWKNSLMMKTKIVM